MSRWLRPLVSVAARSVNRKEPHSLLLNWPEAPRKACLAFRVDVRELPHSLDNIFPQRVRSDTALWCHKLPGKWQKFGTMGLLARISQKSPESGGVNYKSLSKMFINLFFWKYIPLASSENCGLLKTRSDFGGYVFEWFYSQVHRVCLILLRLQELWDRGSACMKSPWTF